MRRERENETDRENGERTLFAGTLSLHSRCETRNSGSAKGDIIWREDGTERANVACRSCEVSL